MITKTNSKRSGLTTFKNRQNSSELKGGEMYG